MHLTGDTLWVFLIALAMVAMSVSLLFLRPRVPIPERLPRGFTRGTLETVNDWLASHGPTFGCMCLPVGSMLALAVLQGGLRFYHLLLTLLIFAMLVVWRMR
jgi:hypothetical protein